MNGQSAPPLPEAAPHPAKQVAGAAVPPPPVLYYLYPSTEPGEYRVGDNAFIWLRSDKATGRAVVLEPPVMAAPASSIMPPANHMQHNSSTGEQQQIDQNSNDAAAAFPPHTSASSSTSGSSSNGTSAALPAPAAPSESAGPPRQRVRYLACGTTYPTRTGRFQRVYRQPGICSVVLCAETEHYRRLARSQVNEADWLSPMGRQLPCAC